MVGEKWPKRHGSRRFAPRRGERSLSLAVAFWFQQVKHPLSASRHLRSFLAPSIGTLPPHRWPDSSLSARSTPFHCNFAGYISVPLRSDGRKLPRPSKTAVRPKIPEAAMLRISAKTGNMAARLRPATDISITARGSACRRGRGNNREIGHFCTASISQATLQRTETAELTGKTRLV